MISNIESYMNHAKLR